MGHTLLTPTEALARQFDLPQPVAGEQRSVTKTLGYHGLLVGDVGLLLDSQAVVSEIFDTLPQCELPNTPEWVHAMANQRGNIIPIFDLALLLGMPKTVTKRPYYLVIGQGEDAFGVLLDQLPKKVSLSPDERLDNRPPLPAMLEPFVGQSYEQDGQIWLEWQPLSFISALTESV